MTGTTALVLADSIHKDHRITTLELNFPMFVQPQLLRHRAFSFSVQSTRAVPLVEQIRRVREHPAMPQRWGRSERGMVAHGDVDEAGVEKARLEWLCAMEQATLQASRLGVLSIHQEVAARLLMPFQWCRAIVTATEWDNFFALRIDSHAQTEIQNLAVTIRDAMAASKPRHKRHGDWHLPYINDDERDCMGDDAVLISAGRCARVSYLQHDGKRNADRDLALGKRLAALGHMSPLEHQATPGDGDTLASPSNVRGWTQARKTYANEDNRAAFLAAHAPVEE